MLKKYSFKPILIVIFCLLIIDGLYSQNYFYAIFPGDTLQLSVNIPTGQVTQWQMTNDTTQSWQPIANSASNTIEIFSEESTTGFLYYRAEISDPNVCSSVFYSDIIKHRIINSSSDAQVGDWFVGGLVFYKDNEGGGLVTTTNDLGNSQWGCFGTYINGTEIGIGKGEANTDSIVYYHDNYLPDYYSNPTQCHPNNDGTVAAKLCDTLILNGYSDWFLPSKDELNLMYTNLHQYGLGNFDPSQYWSSTDSTGNGAWMQDFSSGTQYYYGGKDYVYLVRAIRYYSLIEHPTVSIDHVYNINPISAYVDFTTSGTITEQGICWSNSENPTLFDEKAIGNYGASSDYALASLLNPNSTYYLRAYALNNYDTVYSQQESFITTNEFLNCGSLTDIDGNEYETILIGDQCWMRENIKVSHYPDGSEIPIIEDDSEWSSLNSGDVDDAFCYYNNNINGEKDIYGALYTYAAATKHDDSGNDVQGICPNGWHIPSHSEWQTLYNEIGGLSVAGGRLKDIGLDHWDSPNAGANNSSGFKSLPGGLRTGSFSSEGKNAQYWSSSEFNGIRSYSHNNFYTSNGANYITTLKSVGLSVRCVKNQNTPYIPVIMLDSINNINPVSAKAYATITNNDNIEILEKGICWDTQSNPTIFSDKAINEDDTLSFNKTAVLLEVTTTYYLRAYLITAIDTIYSEEESFTTTADFPNCGTVTDIDGNEYQTVIIGEQCWMRENLKVTHYPDGTEIQFIEDNTEWGNLENNNTDDAYCWYNDDISNKDIHGALYTWAAAMHNSDGVNTVPSGVQGACPDGWHLPNDDEWKILELSIGMSENEVEMSSGNRRVTDEGGILKSTLDIWNEPNLGASNSSGFNAQPSGIRYDMDGMFLYSGRYTHFWSTYDFNGSTGAQQRILEFDTKNILRTGYAKSDGISIRCVKNQNTPYIPVIMLDSINNINPVSAKAYATITNNDNIEILEKGICWDTQSNPTIFSDKGINEEETLSFNETAVLLEASTTYYLKAYLITANDTIYSEEESFTTTADFPNCGTVTDIDGNEYQTVIIGEQCWMRENLNTSKYNDGTDITNITNNDVWEATIIGARTYYDNDSLSYASVYGALYNWYVVSSEKNVCPSGWRIPIDEDWNLLIETVGNVDDLKDNTDIFWDDNGKGTNISGYTSLPAGTRGINFDYGSFNNIGSYTSYWSNSGQYNETHAFSRPIEPNGGMYQDIDKKTTGLSLRCIKDDCDPLTEANAGMDQMVNDTNVVTLDGNIVSNGYGYWNIADGDCGYLEDSLINNTIFAGNYGSTYVLTWNIFNDCNEFSIDTVIISFSDDLSYPLYDFDGNGYDTVRLGSQTWMTNNLKVTHLNDGTPIELIEENSEWSNILSPAMCYYANDCSNKQLFGGLYNWYTVNTNKLCPLGWDVPTHADWEILQDYLITNGYNFDGSNSGNKIAKAMAKRETWTESNSNGTPGDNSYPSFINKSEFSSLPSGIRNYTGTFNSLYDRSYWWSKDEWDIETTPIRIIIYRYPYLQTQTFFKEHGASIRCIKND